MSERQPTENALLAQLPPEELAVICEGLEIIEVERGQAIAEPGRPIEEIYFPLDAIFSLVAIADSRVVVEVATIGREGMVGLPVFLAADTNPHASFCQIPGVTGRTTAGHLRRALRDDGALHRLLNRFTQATIVQIAQNVVCNNSHTTEQRACRWLLMTNDRVGRPEYHLTQDFLAQMLGVRRPTVSETANRLQERGLIRYRRGNLTILDRSELERCACDCYRIVKAEFDAVTAGSSDR